MRITKRSHAWKVGNLSRTGSIRLWLALIAFVGIVAILDYFFLGYLISHGLEPKWQLLQIGSLQLSIPLLGLTFVGVLIVAIAAWTNMASSMPIAAAKEMAQLDTIRILRAAGVALFFFTAVLFGPYVIGADIFWRQMMSLGRSIPQLAGSLQGLFDFVQPGMGWDSLTKLAVSQNLAAAALVAVSGIIGYGQRRIRRPR